MAYYKSRQDKDCELNISGISTFPSTPGFRIEWDSPQLGWGQCDFFFNNKEEHYVNLDGKEMEETYTVTESIQADTEYMANNDHKEFIRALFDTLLEKVEVIG